MRYRATAGGADAGDGARRDWRPDFAVDVAGVLGSSEAVIRKTYGHHSVEHLRAAVDVWSRRPATAPVSPRKLMGARSTPS